MWFASKEQCALDEIRSVEYTWSDIDKLKLTSSESSFTTKLTIDPPTIDPTYAKVRWLSFC